MKNNGVNIVSIHNFFIVCPYFLSFFPRKMFNGRLTLCLCTLIRRFSIDESILISSPEVSRPNIKLFERSWSSHAFSNFDKLIRVCCSFLCGILSLFAIMAVTIGLVTFLFLKIGVEISYSVSAFTVSSSVPRWPSLIGRLNNSFSSVPRWPSLIGRLNNYFSSVPRWPSLIGRLNNFFSSVPRWPSLIGRPNNSFSSVPRWPSLIGRLNNSFCWGYCVSANTDVKKVLDVILSRTLLSLFIPSIVCRK